MYKHINTDRENKKGIDRHAASLLSKPSNNQAFWLYRRILQIIEEEKLDERLLFCKESDVKKVKEIVAQKCKEEGDNVANWAIFGYVFDLALVQFESADYTKITIKKNGKFSETRIHTYNRETIAQLLDFCTNAKFKLTTWQVKEIETDKTRIVHSNTWAEHFGTMAFVERLAEEDAPLAPFDFMVNGYNEDHRKVLTKSLFVLWANIVYYTEDDSRKFRLRVRTSRYDITVTG